MTSISRYTGPVDVPAPFPVFPLRGAILLPRATMPLNIFEPRYLAMVDDCLRGGRVLGIIQPAERGADESPEGKECGLRPVGCVGRLTAHQELDDGRILVTLVGIARFRLVSEVATMKPYRMANPDFGPFLDDFTSRSGEDEVDRDRLVTVLKTYLERRQIRSNLKAISSASTEFLVNTLSVICPYGPEEKQALLEAGTLAERARMLIALAEMDIAGGGVTGGTLQ